MKRRPIFLGLPSSKKKKGIKPPKNQRYEQGYRSMITTPFQGVVPHNKPYYALQANIEELIQQGIFTKEDILFNGSEKSIYFKYDFFVTKALLEANGAEKLGVSIKKPAMVNASICGIDWTLKNIDHINELETHLNNALDDLEQHDKQLQNFPPLTNEKDEPDSDFQRNLIEKILTGTNSTQPGLIIGEQHEHQSPKQFLINHAASLYKYGVRYFFIEHLSECLQKSLDVFHTTGNMPYDLKLVLKNIDTNFGLRDKPYSYTNLLMAMQKNKIKNIAIENAQSYMITSGLDGKASHRCLAMNYCFKQKLEGYKKDKWATLVGSAHVSTHDEVAGLSEITQNPCIVVTDTKESEPQTCQYNVDKGNDHIRAQVHLTLNVEKKVLTVKNSIDLFEQQSDDLNSATLANTLPLSPTLIFSDDESQKQDHTNDILPSADTQELKLSTAPSLK